MTLLDQAIAHGAGSVLTDNVVDMLGAQGVSEIPMLLAEIARGEASEVYVLVIEWIARLDGVG